MSISSYTLWAKDFVRNHGDESPQFLNIQLRIEGACLGFANYMTSLFGDSDVELSITRKLGEFNVKVLHLSEWPGFKSDDFGEVEHFVEVITSPRKDGGAYRSEVQCRVEAEVWVALLGESGGEYHLRGNGVVGGAYFVSQSGFMNALRPHSGETKRFLWKPEGRCKDFCVNGFSFYCFRPSAVP